MSHETRDPQLPNLTSTTARSKAHIIKTSLDSPPLIFNMLYLAKTQQLNDLGVEV